MSARQVALKRWIATDKRWNSNTILRWNGGGQEGKGRKGICCHLGQAPPDLCQELMGVFIYSVKAPSIQFSRAELLNYRNYAWNLFISLFNIRLFIQSCLNAVGWSCQFLMVCVQCAWSAGIRSVGGIPIISVVKTFLWILTAQTHWQRSLRQSLQGMCLAIALCVYTVFHSFRKAPFFFFS